MRISMQTLAVIGVCMVGAAAVFGVVSSRYQNLAELQQQSELSQLAQRDNRYLQLMSAQWLTTIDLFFGYQQTYLVAGISTQAEQLIALLEQFDTRQSPELATIVASTTGLIAGVGEKINQAAIVADPQSTVWNRQITAVDNTTGELIELLDRLDGIVSRQSELDSSTLSTATRALQLTLALALAIYLAVIAAAWLWLNKSIVKPLEILARQSAGQQFSSDSIFLIGKAPREIVALSKGLHGFVARLAKAKSQVEAQKEELEKNIEQLKETRLQLIQSEKLSSIGQLAAGIAHEINNPMSYIKSNLTTLGRYFDAFAEAIALQEKLTQVEPQNQQAATDCLQQLQSLHTQRDFEFLIPDSREILKDSIDGAVRIQGIVKDLYSFAHVNNNGFTQVDLNALVQQAVRILSNQLSADIEVRMKLGEVPAITAEGDKLSQVFLNLLVNAAHAIDGRGRITLATGSRGDKVWLQVKDSGCGIPEDTLVKIFDPFFTTKEVGEGTGLGLHMVQEIVNRHSGKIDVQSLPGKGSLFSVILPVQQSRQRQSTAQTAAMPS